MHSSLDHYWESLIKPLFEAASVKNILEIGSSAGQNTKNLIDFVRHTGGLVTAIDPDPKFDVFNWRMQYPDVLNFMEETSLNALPKIQVSIDAVLIDGDHNWYTVFHELQLLEKHAEKTGEFPLLLLHDIGWPYGRRDMYCDPGRIPASFRQPFLQKGISTSSATLVETGGLNRNMHNAICENSIKNGVLTAVEDFIAGSARTFDWIELPGLFGLGILVERIRLERHPLLAEYMRSLTLSHPVREHLRILEEKRVEALIGATEALQQLHRSKGALLETRRALENAEGELRHRENDLVFSDFIRGSLEKELESLSLELRRMQHSKSWRLTNLLRILEPKIRGFFPWKPAPPPLPIELSSFAESSKLSPSSGQRMIGCTIVSKNFLAHARVLAHSFHEHHPDAEFIILLVDDIETAPNVTGERISIVSINDLPLPERNQFCFRYGLRELHTAVKPFFLEWVFHHRHADSVVYLDPDILMQSPLFSTQKALSSNSIVLTPHVLRPIEDGLRPSDHDVLRVGVFNLGFIGLSDTAVTRDFLYWWQRRVTEDCTEQPDRNVFFDQRWMDLVPAIFSGVYVLRDPTCNVAYWNLHERAVQCVNGHCKVEGSPLTFFHFSGYSPSRPNDLCKYGHSDRGFDSFPAVKPLFDRYRRLLIENGYDLVSGLPYDFGFFDNGVPVPACIRRHFHSLSASQRSRFQNPFLTGFGSYWEWLQSPHSHADSVLGLTNAHFIFWQTNAQMRESIPVFGKEYAEWLAHPDHRHLLPDIASIFLEPLQASAAPASYSLLRSILLRRNTFRWYRRCTEIARSFLPPSVFASIREHL